MKKIIFTLITAYLTYGHVYSKDVFPTIEEICNDLEYEIRDLELMKRNLKKLFKQKEDELEQFELLPELTKDVNNTLKQQILQARLYYYLDCTRFIK